MRMGGSLANGLRVEVCGIPGPRVRGTAGTVICGWEISRDRGRPAMRTLGGMSWIPPFQQSALEGWGTHSGGETNNGKAKARPPAARFWGPGGRVHPLGEWPASLARSPFRLDLHSSEHLSVIIAKTRTFPVLRLFGQSAPDGIPPQRTKIARRGPRDFDGCSASFLQISCGRRR